MADSTTIRKLPCPGERVETGPVQFGDDWPGVFIRGDSAAYFAMAIANVLASKEPTLDLVALANLHRQLCGCIEGPARDMFQVPGQDG